MKRAFITILIVLVPALIMLVSYRLGLFPLIESDEGSPTIIYPADGEPIPIFPDGPVSTLQQYIPCDLNLDEICDDDDHELFRNALNKCSGEKGYMGLADANLDGCVTPEDMEELFPSAPEKTNLLPRDVPKD
ncbi:MAG: hypothetical protein KC684_04640 [Candidatus Omnitrophica bacterium]|nr:hypothetical protein [Candidatus Omnitrophota bacterium]